MTNEVFKQRQNVFCYQLQEAKGQAFKKAGPVRIDGSETHGNLKACKSEDMSLLRSYTVDTDNFDSG